MLLEISMYIYKYYKRGVINYIILHLTLERI